MRRSITIRSSPDELYRRWRDVEKLPTILRHLRTVDEHPDGRTSHWVAKFGPVRAEWDAELVVDEPDRRLAWRTLPGSRWVQDGEVTFRPAPGGRGTELTVHFRIAPRGGRMMLRAAPFLQTLSRSRLGEELRRFKQLVETGEIATNAMRRPAHEEIEIEEAETELEIGAPEELGRSSREEVRP